MMKKRRPVAKGANKIVRAVRASRRAARVLRAAVDPTIANLSKIDHIVVLMLENRSFDHLLGYLSLTHTLPVDGLREGMTNPLPGKPPVSIELLSNTAIEVDPCHSAACVDAQLANNNNGFAANYLQVGGNPREVMGYYDATSVPVYDLLARHYVVCDKWFSSVPGATWPNRLYAMTGQAPKRDNKKIPLYRIPSFVRHLDSHGVSWRWYAHESGIIGPLGAIDCADGDYITAPNVVYFERHFLRAAREGSLPAVSWIDPDFVNFRSKRDANCDHPPADIRAGQVLVQSVVQAISNSPSWPKTMLVITYDEHGGFFDHVPPGPAPGRRPFDRYGVRVPTLIVSPWVASGHVESTIFDHTSILKTVLLRFCRDNQGNIPDMGPRVAGANHIAPLLSESSPRAPLPPEAFQALSLRLMPDMLVERLTQIEPGPVPLNDFQQGWLRAVPELEKRRLQQLQKGVHAVPLSMSTKSSGVKRRSRKMIR